MGAFTYPRSEPGSSGHLDLVEALNGITQTLKQETAGLSEDVASYRPAGGEWSIKDTVAHLCDNAHSLHERLFVMINQEEPFLPSWDQDEKFRERKPENALFNDLINEFSVQRAETVNMLAGLVHWNWARQGRHEERGRLSIRQLVEITLKHEPSHIEQIRQLQAKAAG